MVDTLVFNPSKALSPLNEKFDWKALGTGPKLDDETFIRTSIQEYLK
jgi:hypothetical protein